MSTRLAVLVVAVVAASAIGLAATVLVYPLRPGFGLDGLTFWVLATAVASAAPVHLPRGSIVGVGGSTVVAAAILGGPTAAALVAALGTTEWRELRGRVPWYGTLFNHAEIVLPAILAGVVFDMIVPYGGQLLPASPWTLIATAIAGLLFFGVNSLMVAVSVALRSGTSVRSVLMGDWSVVAASMFALAPLAWLMGYVFASVGWWAAILFALPLATTKGAYARLVEIRDMFTQTIRALSSAVDARDKYTANHSERVQEIAVAIGQQMRCGEAELEALQWGGLLHDIGKIGVPDAVLLKPGRLNKEERTIMNMHPVKGAEIIAPVTRLAPELPIIRHHHEWYNGSGYPDHLVGEAIPKLARILHVADAFEAMTAARPYRLIPLSAEQAMAELRKYAGVQFDPVVLDAFARTHYVAEISDAGRPPGKPIPLLAQAAAMRAQAKAEPRA